MIFIDSWTGRLKRVVSVAVDAHVSVHLAAGAKVRVSAARDGIDARTA